MEAVYRIDGQDVLTSGHAAGPWDATMQHGGAPAALVVWAAGQVPTPVPMHVARVTIELMRPAPVAPMRFSTSVVRAGRKIQLVAVSLHAGGHEVVRAHVLKVRVAPTDLPAINAPPALDAPQPENCLSADAASSDNNPFVKRLSLRIARGGGFQVLGPSAVWFRVNHPVIEGVETTPTMTAAIAADLCNGVASALDFSRWTYLNADLTLSLARPPEGDWILVDGESWFGADGAGMAIGRLADRRGYFGRSQQSLVVEPR